MVALQDALDIKTRSGSCHQGALNLGRSNQIDWVDAIVVIPLREQQNEKQNFLLENWERAFFLKYGDFEIL